MPYAPSTHAPKGSPHRHDVTAKMEAKRQAEKNAIYDSEWRRLRARFLRVNPICSCGCGARAVDVDHILTVRERPDLRLEWSNLRAFSHACHSRRTGRDQSGWKNRAG